LGKNSARWLRRKKIFYDDILIERERRRKRTVILDHYLLGAGKHAERKKSCN